MVLAPDQNHALQTMLRALEKPLPHQIKALDGGKNNRVYRLELPTEALLLKVYFRHPHDSRDRLATEFRFLSFAWAQGLRQIPQPLAQHPEAGMALYDFIEGQAISAEEVTFASVQQALAFYQTLNQHRQHPDAKQIGLASEACFSLDEHLQTIRRRIERFNALEPIDQVLGEVVAFVQDDLQPRFATLEQNFLAELANHRLPQHENIPNPCLSPSDFGFHNALRQAKGTIYFLDFEYAGWDDPAKLVCDFFCQPRIPIPSDFWAEFSQGIVQDDPIALLRIQLLQPLYQIKWACILLNDYLPIDGARRRFAGQNIPNDAQLIKAKQMLQRTYT